MPWKRILLEGDAAVLSNVAPVNVDHTAASAGTATEASRQDHKHDLAEGVLADVKPVDGSAAALGTAAGVSHVDHVHALGPLVADLNFAQKQALRLVVHSAATPPDAGAEVEGQIYFDTTVGDKHLYVWVP